MRPWLYVSIIAFMLVGCADTHQINWHETSSAQLSTNDSIFIATPIDGVYGDQIYTGSGKNTAQIINSAFAKHTNNTFISGSFQTIGEAQLAAKGGGYKYLAYPTILHWEDRATEWSGIPDRIEIKIVIAEAATGSTVKSAIIEGKSGIATFGGDHPQDLLPVPIEEFVSSLYSGSIVR